MSTPVGAPPQARVPPARSTRWSRLTTATRVGIVSAVVVGLVVSIAGAVYTGPPTYSDPLTTRGTYTISPGGFAYLSGWITGEDFIDGNYTVLSPVGTHLVFEAFNASAFAAFVHHLPAQHVASSAGGASGGIVFAAPYTDTFYLVFENPYQPTSGIVQVVYIVTNYQSNVVIG